MLMEEEHEERMRKKLQTRNQKNSCKGEEKREGIGEGRAKSG